MNKYILRSEDAKGQHGSCGWLLKWEVGTKWIKSPGNLGWWCGMFIT